MKNGMAQWLVLGMVVVALAGCHRRGTAGAESPGSYPASGLYGGYPNDYGAYSQHYGAYPAYYGAPTYGAYPQYGQPQIQPHRYPPAAPYPGGWAPAAPSGQAAYPGMKAAAFAQRAQGRPYCWGGTGPKCFDCSGLTSFAWRSAGHELTRQSGSQISQAERLARDTAKAGDLVHYPGHVMMYLGVGDAIVHSVQTGRTVEIDTISGRRRNSVRWGDPTL